LSLKEIVKATRLPLAARSRSGRGDDAGPAHWDPLRELLDA